MIEGRVNSNNEATVFLDIRDPTGSVRAIEAVIDTGFTEYLTLPQALISLLRMPYADRRVLILADGSPRAYDVYHARLDWDGELEIVPAYAIDAKPLVGLRLLEGYSLHMDIINGGTVVIEPITRA